MPDEPALPAPDPQPINPGPTPTGCQRTQGGGFKRVPPCAGELSMRLPQYEVEALDRAVTIKIPPPEVDAEYDSYTARFKNEARIMARLEHPAIVPVYDFGETSTGLRTAR